MSKAMQAGSCARRKGRPMWPNSPDVYKESKKI